MCFLKPLRVEKIEGKTVYLENGIKALYDKRVGEIVKGNEVLVYGNLIIEKIHEKSK